MYGGWRLFSPTLLVEMEENLLIRWVAPYALTSVWRRGERGKHTRSLASPGRAGRGEVRRWERAHDMRMNSPPKSSPKPRRSIAVFIRSSSSRNRKSHTVSALKSCLTYLIC
jgi:hypothetical protein